MLLADLAVICNSSWKPCGFPCAIKMPKTFNGGDKSVITMSSSLMISTAALPRESPQFQCSKELTARLDELPGRAALQVLKGLKDLKAGTESANIICSG